ncbi:MAG: putative sugar O-methyltransferase [Pseudoalteromonas sp.]
MNLNENLVKQLEKQSSLYKPSVFWQEATAVMLGDLKNNHLENFRSLPSSLIFFVPTYGYPGNSFSKENIQSLKNWVKRENLNKKQEAYLDQFTTGYSAALADYRTLAASEYGSSSKPNLLSFSESKIGKPIEHFEIDGSYYSRSAMNYLNGLSFLKKHVDISQLNSVMEIGGGFGSLGEILHQTLPNVKYIDIPPTIYYATYYLQQIMGKDSVSTYEDIEHKNSINLLSLKKYSVLPSWTIEMLQGEIDLFINFISFQEMEPDIVENYLNNIDRLQAKWILLRNSREGKALRSKQRFGVDKSILSEDYIKMLPNYSLIETNVYPYGFKTVDGFHSEIMLFKRNEETV